MFDDATVRAVATIAARLKVEPAALLAVAEIESGGRAYARVAGKNEPLIRFEGHYFDKRLTSEQRKKARAAGLSSPKTGGVPNPSKQEDRWKLLNRAIAINANAALESTSWGLGQVMGAHWRLLGYASVADLVNEARSSVAGQVEIMARFIEKNGLAGLLRDKQWAKFARAYNGPAYRQNRYDTKMAAAYAKWQKAIDAAHDVSRPVEPAVTIPAAPVEPPKPVEASPEPQAPPSPPITPTPPVGRARGIWALIAAALLASWVWLSSLPCEWLGMFCGG